MIKLSGRVAALCAILAGAVFATVTPAFSQAPTDAQRSAIRSACRSDYMAHCSDVAPGGLASLQCLQKNMSSLSSSCASAVRAVEASAEPKTAPKAETKADTKPESKTESKPEPASGSTPAAPVEKPAAKAGVTPKAAAAPSSNKPSRTQADTIRKATGAAPPSGGGVTAPAEGNAPAADAATTAADATPAVAPMVLRPMRPREVIFVLRSACGGDVRALCGSVPAGGGRIIQCLASQAASLSPECHDVLGSFAQ